MGLYRVVLSKSAEKEFGRVQPARVRQRILDAITDLSIDPRPRGARQILGQTGRFWRIRVGDHRVAYWIDQEVGVVHVTKVGHRQGFYS